MKMRRNLSSFTVYAAVATVLAACSANPVEDSNNKKTIAANAVKKTEVAKKVTKTKSAAIAKKKAIIAMAKQSNAASSVKKPVKLAQATVRKKPVSRKPVSRVRSPQPVGSRSKQAVGIRSPQPVGTRSKQKVGVRSVQPVGTRAKQAVKKRHTPQASRSLPKPPAKRWVTPKKPVQPRVVLAARKPVQNRVVRTSIRKPTKQNYRKAVYRKPVQKRTVQRIAPNQSFGYALSNAAIERTKHRVRYDGRYLKIGYPWGDVPKSIGVCTDVVIRSYRKLGIDLQQEVHKDISNDFYAYPNLAKWGLDKPDPNIDHRRVYNLQAFFKRHKAELPRSRNPRHYKPGDLVTWMVGPNFPHIGVVVNKPSPADPNRLMISHNVGAGPVIEDILFKFPMTGHYRYTPAHRKVNPALHFAKTPPPPSVLRKQQQNQLTYAQLLQASRALNAPAKAAANPVKLTSAAKKQPPRMYLAQLDSVITSGSSDLNSAAVQALLKN